MRRVLLILLLTIQTTSVFGQKTIKGRVVDSSDLIPKTGVNITLKNPSDSSTFAFGFSNHRGEFSIEYTADLENILIQLTAMTIKKTSFILPVSQSWIEIKVQSAELELDEVMIEGRKNPISFKKDTITYAVEGFSTTNDRVIGDIIKRLPGIEVLSNGMIQYLGKPLGKFYIDGLDLLQGRYNLANKNLPVDAVKSIEILENHQPIKILDSLVFSDRAALNLVLNKKNTWIGTGLGGLGGSPLVLNTSLSPMVFRENFQSLLSIQANNFGIDLSDEQKTLTVSTLQNMLEENKLKNWFSVPSLKNGVIPRKRTLFNKSLIGSANVLTKTAPESEFRIMIDFFRQIQNQNTGGSTIYFLPTGDSIRFTEDSRATFIQQNLKSSFNWTKNQANKFIDNSIYFEIQSDTETAKTVFNGINQAQEAILPLIRFGNKLSVLAPIGQVILEINSYTSFQRTNQQFTVSPSGFESIFADSINVQLDQNLLFSRFFSNNSIGFKKPLSSKLILNASLGLDFDVDQLESDLWKIGNRGPERTELNNRTNYFLTNPYAKSGLEFRSNQFIGRIDLPLHYSWIQSIDEANQFTASLSKIYSEPTLYLRYQFNGRLYSTGTLRKFNTFGTGEDFFPELILTTLRSLNLRNTRIPERITKAMSYGIFFKDPVSSIFMNVNFGYQQIQKNTITRNILINTGETIFSADNIFNNGKQGTLSFKGSKYFTDLYTTFTLGSTFRQQQIPQITNDQLIDYSLASNIYLLELATKPKKTFGISYKINYTTLQTSDNLGSLGKVLQWGQAATLELFPIKNHLLMTNFEFISNQTESQNYSQKSNFLDLTYTFKIPSKRLSMNLICMNALNNQLLRNYFTNGFVLSSQEFPLRPRQLMFQLDFSF